MATAAARTSVVFIHGLWLHADSWAPWVELFRAAGYDPIAPGWPGEPASVALANAHPEQLANVGIDEVVDHYAAIIRKLPAKPIVIGHSFGGLVAQKLLGMGLASAAVALDPAQVRGVLPLPLAQLRSAFPVLGNPFNYRRAISQTPKQFYFGFGNAVSEQESNRLHGKYHIPAPGKPLFQAALANLNPWTEDKVDSKNPDRGPLLLISGELDHTVPWAIVNASYKQQQDNPGVTEIVKIKGRGHALTIDSGWREVADTALAFVQRFT
jgi:pimeloyl-ACP methyl ester carboxylesterase